MDVVGLNLTSDKFMLRRKFCSDILQARRTFDKQIVLNISKANRGLPSLLLDTSRSKHSTQVCQAGGGAQHGAENDEENFARKQDEEVDEALHLDGQIPQTSGEFLKQVSSRAYDMRRQLKQSIDSSSYDVLEANPWREDSKPVYVLAQRKNQLWTMRTRRTRSEVEKELGLLFPKQGKKNSGIQRKSSGSDTRFQMLVEDVREGVLVFEDEEDAAKYCSLLEGHGQGCAGVAELEASSVFDLCHNMRALAVLFRRGRTPPLPDNLEINLKARKRSLEDYQ